MATAGERSDIATLKTDVAVIKTELGYIKRTLDKVDKFVDDNKAGIRTASLLDNKIITVFIGAIILAGVYFLGKSGGL